MKNKGNIRKLIKTIFKIVFFPVYFFIALIRFTSEKIGFSIRLKLSLIYVRKLLNAMLWAGIIVILAFGILKVYNTIAYNYKSVSNLLPQEGRDYSKIENYSRDNRVHVLIYDSYKNVVFATEPALADYGYKETLSFINAGSGFYLTINETIFKSGRDIILVIYSDIQNEIDQTIELSKIILYVFAIVTFFSVITIAGAGKGVFYPIREMTETVRDISESNLNLRLNVSGSKNELKELSITFNEMMNRIEEDYNRQKQFVSDASHELRTPIAVVQGYVDMLNRWGKNDSEVLQESIDAIKNESENMKDLVDKLLFLARNDKGSLVFQKEEFSLTEMLVETVKETQIIDTKHKINCSINEEISLYADRNRIKQAVRIFIDNAIKYTPTGGEINIGLCHDESHIKIIIKDTGIGMTKEELEHIFDRFYRSDKSRTREKGGHGLGLAIARVIILGHNGKIKVRSRAGEGSEFTILLGY